MSSFRWPEILRLLTSICKWRRGMPILMHHFFKIIFKVKRIIHFHSLDTVTEQMRVCVCSCAYALDFSEWPCVYPTPANYSVNTCSMLTCSLGPRPSRTQKSVWGLSHDFLVVLTRHILTSGKPMRTPARCRHTKIM